MSDTALNQAEYPQHKNQAPGCGFPIAKLVVMFSLVTGLCTPTDLVPFLRKPVSSNTPTPSSALIYSFT